MRVECLSIGSELLSGTTINTNAAYLSAALSAIGLPVQRHTVVADEPDALAEAFREVLGRADLVIATGGLGPTVDDITVACLAEASGRPLTFSAEAWKTILAFYKQRKRRLHAAARRQAMLPEGAEALPNALGTAPGIWLKHETCLLICLPGVPREMRSIMEETVLPRLKRLSNRRRCAFALLRTAGIPELDIQKIIQGLNPPAALKLGLYPNLHAVDVRLEWESQRAGQAERLLRPWSRRIGKALGTHVYAEEPLELETAVGALLKRRRWSLSVAESCTGGLLSSRLTDVPGSSDYLVGSVVAYSNRIKESALGVPETMLQRYGAVSPAVARAMAQGVRRRFDTNLGVAITGIAGPAGGSAKKPVGLVYFALDDARGTEVHKRQLGGNRTGIKQQAAQIALNLIRLRVSAVTRDK